MLVRIFRLATIGLVFVNFCAMGIGQAVAEQTPPAKPATAPAAVIKEPGGTLTGHVGVPAGQKLPEMIVYLKSTDPKYTFQLPKAEKELVVSQRDAKFSPGLLIVPVGSKIDFKNDETKAVEHNVFSNSEAKKFDLGLYRPGGRVAAVEFDKPGPVRLRCSIHRYMDGVVYVTPTPYFCVVDKDGVFSIAGVKPGAYTIKTWQRSQRYREQEIPVNVVEGKPVDLKMELSR